MEELDQEALEAAFAAANSGDELDQAALEAAFQAQNSEELDQDALNEEYEIEMLLSEADVDPAEYRQQLEEELAGYNAERERRQSEIDYAESDIGDRALATVFQFGANLGYLPRLIADTPAALSNVLFGTEFQGLAGVPGLEHLGRGDYVPEGSASRMAVDAASIAAEFGMGVLPVARSAGASSSVVADILGIGSTVDKAGDAARMTAQAIPAMHRNAEVPGLFRENVDWNNPEMVQDIISDINTQTSATDLMKYRDEYNRTVTKYDNAQLRLESELAAGKLTPEQADKRLQKLQNRRKESMDQLDEKVRTDWADSHPTANAMSFNEQFADGVIEKMARVYDLPKPEATRIVLESGGVDAPDSFSSLMKLRNEQLAEDLFTAQGVMAQGGTKARNMARSAGMSEYEYKQWEEFVRPAVALIRENVGAGAANKVEVASLRGAVARDKIVAKYNALGPDLDEVIKWADTPQIKRQFLNLYRTGVDGRAALLQQARQNLQPSEYDAFEQLVDDAIQHQKQSQQYLLRSDQKRDAVYWGSRVNPADETSRLAKIKEMETRRRGTRSPNSISQLSTRLRRDADQMTDAQLAEYENPIVAQLGTMMEEIDMIEMAKNLDMPAALRVGDNIDNFIEAAQRHVAATTRNPEKGATFGTVINGVVKGARAHQSPWVSAYMNASYAGTLGYFISSALQIADQIITAFKTSPRDALAAVTVDLLNKNRIKPQNFGIATNAYNTREFREGLEQGFMERLRGNRSTGQAVADGSAEVANVYFKAALFQTLDRSFKGGTLRATFRNMQRLAGQGDEMQAFMSRYGSVLPRGELAEVRQALIDKVPFDKMTPRQQYIMEGALVARLGQQQLISSASRPLMYLNHPAWRPFYALRGFAIVQQDILKTEVIDEFAKNGTKAGAAKLAQWLLAVAGGYMLTDTMRDAASALAVGDEEKFKEELSLEKLQSRFVEGGLGPVTLNLAGDPYTFSRMGREDPLAVIAENAIPPTGLMGTGLQMAMGAAQMDEKKFLENAALLVPGAGRELRAMIKNHYDNDPMYQFEQRMKKKQERLEKMME